MKGEPLRKRFDDKWIGEPMSGCWLWEGAIFKRTGYGQMRMNKKIFLAHRIAWELHRGPIPQGEGYHGICVCHRCDNPFCVNPDHLFLGTHTDNMQDKANKGRTRPGDKGSKCHLSSLTEEQVLSIRKETGRTYTDIAKDYGVTRTAISSIIRRKQWKHI